MIFINKKGKVVYVNEKCEESLGYSRKEFYSPDFDFLTLIAPEYMDLINKNFKRHIIGEEAEPYENAILTNRGKKIDTIITTRLIKYEGENAILGIATNITEHKRMEEELQKANKLESIGTLAGGIAHDFNNLLTGIIGNISLAKMYMTPEDKIYKILTNAETASLEASHLTKQLITFARGGEPIMEKTHIGKLIKDSALFALSGSKVKCETSISSALWPVEIDGGQIRQVIHNIIVNAKEAMPDGGIVNISAKNLTTDNGQGIRAKGQELLKEGRHVRISIEDHGIGIAEEHLRKIFDPYFTTKEKGAEKGMGLGLSISHSIINKHNGYLTVESAVGVGSTIHIYLPASSSETHIAGFNHNQNK